MLTGKHARPGAHGAPAGLCKVIVRPAKTQRRIRGRPESREFLLSSWRIELVKLVNLLIVIFVSAGIYE
jgi:hypothetical protein